MSNVLYSEEHLDQIHNAIQSLKLYRRAELSDPDTGEPLIEALYVDPLPANQAFRTITKAHTTFLIGRKGTGKSTIFQRGQFEVRKHKISTSAYLDIKTIYESSQVDSALLAKLEQISFALPQSAVKQILLHRTFLRSVVEGLKKELEARVRASLWERIKDRFQGTLNELFQDLDELLENQDDESFINAIGISQKNHTTKTSCAAKDTNLVEAGGSVKATALEVTGKASSSHSQESGQGHDTTYTEILLRTLNTKELLERIKKILSVLGIKHLYLFIDDFSELPEDAMRIVVDVLLAPLNNWSDEFIKLKIAAYPGRIYYGGIDKTKIDEIYLDPYNLYGSSDVATMEERAIDFTTRLIDNRINHFCAHSWTTLFEDGPQNFGRHLFFACMGNPRILGYILHYLYESTLIAQKKITLRSISDAAKRYYEEKLESYFSIGKFLHEDFGERSSIYSLKELLESLVSRARALRSHESEVFKKISGRPPTSHFHVRVDHERLLSTLELNFFVTKYFEMSDRDGAKVSVYALNYGLCSKYTIAFGRPEGEREFRLYFVERVFDYTPLLREYMAKNQEIVCSTCGARHPFEHLEALRLFQMRCPKCGNGICSVTNLSKKYEQEIRAVDEQLLLPQTELGILQTLHNERLPLRPAAIATELDCSWQLIGWRGKNLEAKNLIERSENEAGQRIFTITGLAETSYFSDTSLNGLDLPNGPYPEKTA